ncbi:MAG: hypothetical protein ACTSSE_05700 [Candidatus Thorarchaeota archaeon]
MASNYDVGKKSNSYSILRFVNVTRMLLYGIAIMVQLFIWLDYFGGIGYYLLSIIVPFIMIIMDILRYQWSKNPFKEYLLVSVFVCLGALGTSMMTVFPLVLFAIFPLVVSFEEYIISLLSLGVIGISVIDLLTLIYLTRPQEQYDEEPWETKKDTIGIQ